MTTSPSMCCISRGTPGRVSTQLRSVSTMKPGAVPTGGDHRFGAREGQAHRLGDAFGVVADSRLPEEIDPRLAQRACNELGIAVEDIAEKQLGANRDDFDRHGGLLRLSVSHAVAARKQAPRRRCRAGGCEGGGWFPCAAGWTTL